MLLEQIVSPWRKIRATNATDNGFPSRIPTLTEPSGIGDNAAQATASAVINLTGTPNKRGSGRNKAMFIFFGSGNDNATFSARIIGWRQVREDDPTLELWIPSPLCEVQCTLSACVGVGSRALASTDRIADTITAVSQPKSTDTDSAGAASTGAIRIYSPVGDIAAYVEVPLFGWQKLEVTFTTGGSATGCNGLVAFCG